MKLIFIVWLFLFMIIDCGSNKSEDNLKTISVNEMTLLIGRQLPKGSPKEKVISFFIKNNIEYNIQPDSLPSPDGNNRIWLVAFINQPSWLYKNYRLDMVFYFEKEGNTLVDYSIRNTFTSL